MIMRMQITLLLMMTTKVDEPEGEDEIAGRLEQLRTLITDRFSSTDRWVFFNRQTGFFNPKESESFWFQWRKVFNPMKRK